MARGISNKKLEEIQALNKKLVSKKKRIEKKYGVETPEIQPIDTSLRGKALKDSIEQAQSFTNPHNQKYQYVRNKHGVVLTKSEITKTKLFIAQAERIRKGEIERISKLPITSFGMEVTTVGDRLNAHGNSEASDKYRLRFNKDSFTTRRHFEKWLEGKQDSFGGRFLDRRRDKYKNNYINTLKDVFNDTSDLKPLLDHISGMSSETFYIKAITDDQRELQYIYEERRRTGVLQVIGESWGIDLGLTMES